MVREILLDRTGISAKNVHRIHGESAAEAEALRYAREIEETVPFSQAGRPVFDLILLGVGEDGHTASLFPDSDLNKDGKICAVTRHPESGQKRITLTLPVINQAKYIVFMVSGSSKADIVTRILQRTEGAGSLPAAQINPSEGDLMWFLDQQAAVLL
jgi:6-phosphogluconolactonase